MDNNQWTAAIQVTVCSAEPFLTQLDASQPVNIALNNGNQNVHSNCRNGSKLLPSLHSVTRATRSTHLRNLTNPQSSTMVESILYINIGSSYIQYYMDMYVQITYLQYIMCISDIHVHTQGTSICICMYTESYELQARTHSGIKTPIHSYICRETRHTLYENVPACVCTSTGCQAECDAPSH